MSTPREDAAHRGRPMGGGTVAIVQARMTSTRLPGKALLPIAGRPMLWYQLQRMRAARTLDRIVVATTTNGTDDAIADFCDRQGCDCARGPEHDVLARYATAAAQFDAQRVVRLTADCPLLPPALIDEAVDAFAATQPCDYLSNMLEPRHPCGMAVEVMQATVLLQAAREARDPQEREHVTPFIYWRPQRFRLVAMKAPSDLSHHRWTVDTAEDFDLVSRILGALHDNQPDFGIDDVLALLERHPEWASINSHVQQKRLNRERGRQ